MREELFKVEVFTWSKWRHLGGRWFPFEEAARMARSFLTHCIPARILNTKGEVVQ